MIADPEGPPFITRTVGRRRYADDASVSHDPQRSWSTRTYCDATIASTVRKLILWSRHSHEVLRRRKLIALAGGVPAWPLAARAAVGDAVIGYLSGGPPRPVSTICGDVPRGS